MFFCKCFHEAYELLFERFGRVVRFFCGSSSKPESIRKYDREKKDTNEFGEANATEISVGGGNEAGSGETANVTVLVR